MGTARAREADTFSMHRRSHYGLVIGLLVFLIVGETAALHLFLWRHSHAAAFLLSASSISLALWLIRDALALRRHPLRVTDTGLVARVGLRWRTFVPYDAIRSVGPALGSAPSFALKALVLGSADVQILTTRPLEARDPLGRPRQFVARWLTVDEPAALIAALSALTNRHAVATALRQDEPAAT
jgi:hypothetical protein